MEIKEKKFYLDLFPEGAWQEIATKIVVYNVYQPDLKKIYGNQKVNWVVKTLTQNGFNLKKIPFKSSGKNKAQNAFYKAVSNSKTPKIGIVPCLPHTTFEMEQNISMYNYVFQAFNFPYRKNDATLTKIVKKEFEAQQKFILSNTEFAKKLTLTYGDINTTLLMSCKNQYPIIAADWCGKYESNKHVILHIIKNDVLQFNGLFFITLSNWGGGEKELKELVKKFGRGKYEFEKIEGDNDIYHYQGSQSGKGAGMIAAIIRRISE